MIGGDVEGARVRLARDQQLGGTMKVYLASVYVGHRDGWKGL